MTNIEKATELKDNNDFAMRSCWECNPAHDHFKEKPGLFVCFCCDRWFMNGGFFDNDEHCDKKFCDEKEN
jgi:hypothetical protein